MGGKVYREMCKNELLFNQRHPKRSCFLLPNDIWKWELKLRGFAILAYLCYLHVHCNKDVSPSADEIASQLYMSKDMAEVLEKAGAEHPIPRDPTEGHKLSPVRDEEMKILSREVTQKLLIQAKEENYNE